MKHELASYIDDVPTKTSIFLAATAMLQDAFGSDFLLVN